MVMVMAMVLAINNLNSTQNKKQIIELCVLIKNYLKQKPKVVFTTNAYYRYFKLTSLFLYRLLLSLPVYLCKEK